MAKLMSRTKLIITLTLLLAAVIALSYATVLSKPRAPVQPIEYSHRLHVGVNKIDCTQCHENGQGKTARMLIPSAQKCAICHQAIKADSPEVQKILKHAEAGTEPPWKRVFGMPASANVHFTHVPHLRAKISCQTCHGKIEEMDRVYRAVDQTMGWCLECHRQTPNQLVRVPNTNVQVNRLTDCVVCHR